MKLYSQNLTASKDTRVIEGKLLPFGEHGYTNLGRVTASRGSLTLPDHPITLNLEHDQKRPVGVSTVIDEREDGIYASFRVLNTAAGNDALEEIEAGVRAALSIEIEKPVIRAGAIMSGTVDEAGLVTKPAFPSARLAASEQPIAEDTGEIETDEVPEETEDEKTEPTESESTTETDKESTEMANAKVSQGGALTASKTNETVHDKNWLFAALAGSQTDKRLTAALSDIVPADVVGIEQPQYIGELWNGKKYQRRFVPLFAHATLNSFEVTGWRWTTKPEVAAYAGNKTDVPSNEVGTEQVKIAAERIAGAHDIDRKFRDFSNSEFWNAYFSAMTESYARVSDAAVLADVVAGATQVTRGDAPEGVALGLVSIVDGALSILNETDTMPTAAVVATDLWRDLILTKHDDRLAYLSAAVGLEDGKLDNFKIVPSAQLEAGQVLVTARDAVTVHELGKSPIRVEALDIARGGIDQGVFGYYAVNIHDAGGLALVTAGEGA